MVFHTHRIFVFVFFTLAIHLTESATMTIYCHCISSFKILTSRYSMLFEKIKTKPISLVRHDLIGLKMIDNAKYISRNKFCQTLFQLDTRQRNLRADSKISANEKT